MTNLSHNIMNAITVITTAIIKNKDGEKILLVKRANKVFFGTWGLPGGKVKYRESINDAVLREHKEELNIGLFNLRFVNYFEFFDPDHAIVFCFEGQAVHEIIPDPKEVAECRWFSFKEIKHLTLAPNHLSVINYYYKFFLNYVH